MTSQKKEKLSRDVDRVVYILGSERVSEKNSIDLTRACDLLSKQLDRSIPSAKTSLYRAVEKKLLVKVGETPARYAFTDMGLTRYKTLIEHETPLEGASRTFGEFIRLYYRDTFFNCVNEHTPLLKIKFSDIQMGLGLDFADVLREHPQETLEIMKKQLLEVEVPVEDEFRPDISIVDLETYRISVQEARKVQYLNQLIEVEGRIMVQKDVRPVYLDIAYVCRRCDQTMYVTQERGKRVEPFECENGVCGRKGPWKLDVANSKIIDSQDVILESTEGDVHLSVILDDPLCTSNVWERDAKVVRVVGILGMMEVCEKNKIETNFVLRANSIELAEESAVPPPTEEEVKMFEEWAKDPVELRKKLINNIAPNLYGLNDEKDALCLSFFSDWTWKIPAGQTHIRSSLHILLIGDPGVGKSDLIKDAVKHAPKGILGQGENATGKGLSNAATQENGIWAIKAGLFAKGDGGIIGLDELDKIDPKERNSLHSILVAQKQIVDKAGKHVEFDTRCAALCAANPKNGHIDRYEPIIKQLGFTSTIFQRFDLVFVMIDVSDSEKDSKIYRKISETSNNSPLGDIAHNRAIPLETYKKYIIYARTKPVPDMAPEADELLEQFYLHARSKARKDGIGGTDYPVISHRSAGALNKLAKCIARRELAPKVTAEHARYAISLYRKSIISVGMGEEDLMSLETGGTGSQFNRIKAITDSLIRGKNTGKMLTEIAGETGYPLAEVAATLTRMKTNGEVIESRDIYRWVGK